LFLRSNQQERKKENNMAQLTPYLTFNGNCKEAMEFYHACLGGELFLQTVGESPAKDQMPPQTQNDVMHSRLAAGELVFMASDMMGPGELVRGNATALAIIGRSKAEIQEYFDKLSEGGTVGQPLTDTFFGTFGSLTDKFGVNWMFQADNA
jgi:PhnB protein